MEQTSSLSVVGSTPSMLSPHTPDEQVCDKINLETMSDMADTQSTSHTKPPSPNGINMCINVGTNTECPPSVNDFSGQTTALTFTPLTCIELIPKLTPEQTRREVAYFENLTGTTLLRESRSSATTQNFKVALKSVHMDELSNNYVDLLEEVSVTNKLIHNFSCNIQRIEGQTEQIQRQLESAQQFIKEITQPRPTPTTYIQSEVRVFEPTDTTRHERDSPRNRHSTN